MSNLRWILLLAGCAILLLLYFSGRPKKKQSGASFDTSGGEGYSGRGHEPDDGYSDGFVAHDGPGDGFEGELRGEPGGEPGGEPYRSFTGSMPTGSSYIDPTQAHDPLMGETTMNVPGPNADDTFSPSEVFGTMDPGDLARPGGVPDEFQPHPDFQPHSDDISNPVAPKPGSSPASMTSPVTMSEKASGVRSISEKIEAFGEKLSPKRKSRVAASVPPESTEAETSDIKVVVLHVVSADGRMIDGRRLLEAFEQRGYHFGDMQVFHSMHEGQSVFSIAKIIEPGSFDLDDIQSFNTPGLVFILQLPGPVAGDVAFEVLVSEAQEIASTLGCTVLDSDHSTLSKQTVQHLRESVYEYMHRQKYFARVPS